MRSLVVGAAIIDMRLEIPALPERGGDVYCSKADMMVGGCAYNVAVTLRNMGVEHDLCVPVGVGNYADVISAELRRLGYDVLVRDGSADNGFCLALVDAEGERTFITYPGVEGSFKREWLDSLDMSRYDFIYVVGYQVCDEAGGGAVADWLLGQGDKTVFFAPGPVFTSIPVSVVDRILSVRPVLHLNDKEACDFTGESEVARAAEALYARTHNTVIITLGEGGCAWFDGEALRTAPAVGTSVVDTIGAGDSHVAAVIGCLSRGYSLERSMVYANRVASGIVGISGPVMDRADFRAFMGE